MSQPNEKKDRRVDEGHVLTAMMLLEMGIEGMAPQYGTSEEYAIAAHSFLQVARGSQHAWDKAAEMAARIFADAAIEDAKDGE